MNISIAELKKIARENLDGKWDLAILVTLIYSIVDLMWNLVPDNMNNLKLPFNLTNIIVNSLLVFGYMKVILNISRGKSIDLAMLFSGFDRFFKALGISILLVIYVSLWALLLIVPGIIAAISYSMTFFIWVDNPDIRISEAIKRSKELTRGHKLEIFYLFLSFIGWILLVSVIAIIIGFWFPPLFGFAFSLGMVILEPYMSVSLATMYNKLTGLIL